MGRELHQLAAIDERDNLHAGGQDEVVEFVHLGVNALERGVGIRALAHQHDSGHHVLVVDNPSILAANRASKLP